MPRKKIVLQTNAPWLRTGLAENGRTLFNWLAARDKYDLVYYCTQVGQSDHNLNRLPYKAYGAIPADPNWPNGCRGDYGCVRDVHYGGRFIQDIVKAEKPDIWVGSDDAWAFPQHYFQADWFQKINSVLHITVDSKPIAPLAYEQAKACRHFLTWAKFGADEMKKRDPKCGHVDYIYGASDTAKFRPVSAAERAELRKQTGLDLKSTIFVFLGRNQLRKEFGNVLQAFGAFKKENPKTNAKLLLHTDWKDAGNGWDIPRLRDYFGIDKADVLATYFCRSCRRWEVKAYDGEEKDCRFCGATKSQVTVNGFNEGVEDDELYQIYGLADASVSAFTSGGLEYTSINSLLCGLPLACTDYSCGEDFCAQPFIYPIKWHSRHEVQSSFIKAANDIDSIKEYMVKVYRMRQEERQALGEQGRDWAAKTFGIDAVGAKWEALFDSMKPVDWSSVTLEYKPKNVAYPMPDIADNGAWVKALYNNILLVEPDPDGFKHWIGQLERGISRGDIYRFFIERGREDNAKNQPPADFNSILTQNGRKRILFVMKESGGDLFISTALFKGLTELYPDADLYVAADPKFHDILAGNPYIHKTIPYHPAMDHELVMRQYVDYCYFAAKSTQRVPLDYLTHDKVSLNLNASIE